MKTLRRAALFLSLHLALLWALVTLVWPGMVFAETAAPAVQVAKAAPAPDPSPIPDAYKLNLLIRSTVIALNQANMTGNYSVLRDLAAPGFQQVNNQARLGEIFAALRKRNLDLSPIMFFDPKLVRPAVIQSDGLLRLSGFIPTQPEQVDFDLAFQQVGGQWRLFGIAVETRRVAVPEPVGAKAGAAKGPEKTGDKSGEKTGVKPVTKNGAVVPPGGSDKQ